jgi:hypothetical protein
MYDTPIERMFDAIPGTVAVRCYGSNMCSIERTFDAGADTGADTGAAVTSAYRSNARTETVGAGR